jgi:hypothetical protein
MAKKRTLVPFYGKQQQRLDTAAATAMRRGDKATADLLYTEGRKIYDKRKKAHAS